MRQGPADLTADLLAALRSSLPLVGQLRSYDRALLRGDLVAGVAVAALVAPRPLGYADIPVLATADALEDRLRSVIHDSPELTGIVLDREGINVVDSQGAVKMGDIATVAGVFLRLGA